MQETSWQQIHQRKDNNPQEIDHVPKSRAILNTDQGHVIEATTSAESPPEISQYADSGDDMGQMDAREYEVERKEVIGRRSDPIGKILGVFKVLQHAISDSAQCAQAHAMLRNAKNAPPECRYRRCHKPGTEQQQHRVDNGVVMDQKWSGTLEDLNVGTAIVKKYAEGHREDDHFTHDEHPDGLLARHVLGCLVGTAQRVMPGIS